jgi:hypothetical protein
VGVISLAMVGCGEAEESVPAVEQPTPAPGGDMPAPPEGGVPGDMPSFPEVDLATAAAELGVTEQQLSEALGDLSQGPMDLAAAAEQLGVSEESLREALGFPEGGPPPGGPTPGNSG